MDDVYKEYRKSKPQQRIYKPGSGPLRRSGYGLDSKMDNCNVDSMGRGQVRGHYGSHNSINEEPTSKDRFANKSRYKKPEQQLYLPRSGDSSVDIDKQSHTSGRCDNSSQYNNRRNNASNKQDKHGMNSAGSYRNGSRKDRSFADHRNREDTNNDVNYHKNFRHVSETRSISPTHSQAASESYVDRNRDSRSMETSAGRHMFGSSGKPPSGRRNSAGYASDQSRPKYMNLENMPPRFRKMYLEQSGHHSFESVDHISRDSNMSNSPSHSNYNHAPFYNSNATWSQTLPSRGRGRLKENETFDRDKFVNSYIRNYEVQNSRRSTPSNSYMNLYESTAAEARSISEKMNNLTINTVNTTDHTANIDSDMKNGLSNSNSDLSCSKSKNENGSDSETNSHISSTYMDIKNLDWTEEVEKNIKLDDLCDSSTSFPLSKPSVAQTQPPETKSSEPKEGSSKRRGRSKRRDKRSRSRGQVVNPEKKPERPRRDSNVSVQQEPMPCINKQRERRDSHRSNRSSNLGNSRDDLSNWRSLRSYSREQSTERKIVSQCNSRDTSMNRPSSPRDHDGFRIPSKPANWSANQPNPKKNGAWPGRGPSSDRGRQSPAPIPAPIPESTPEPAAPTKKSRKRSGRRKTRHSDIAQPVPVPPGSAPAPTNMNWRDEIIESKKHSHDKQPEPHYERTRLSSTRSEKSITDVATSQPGVIILPQGSMSHMHNDNKNIVRGGSVENQKTLYDHHNPSKPIIVQTSPSKINMRMEQAVPKDLSSQSRGGMYEASLATRAARHRALLQQVDRADAILQTHMLQGASQLANHWTDLRDTRKLLQNALHKLLMSDLKYCQADNIEHHFWKILYYNFIEVLRKSFTQVTPEEKAKIVKLLNNIIDEGNTYFENLVQMLENMYKFSTEDYINDNHILPPKGLGYVGLALISVQKLYVFLGDLARYKEQVNETNNYAKSKFWYTKAQQINPKNGRPYNQLAILAIYARRKLDAVYYYMRSLMSSNPFQSARESLLSLFDENSKKFEAAERKRRAALETSKPENGDNGSSGPTTTGEHGSSVPATTGHGFRREVWIRPGGHKTTTLSHDTRDEHLSNMSSVELNKSFITSYLHVHGKLITRIGMESFHTSAARMLRQFRCLLQRQPLPTPAARLLQLTALNMFAVETNHQPEPSSPRSPWLDCALGVSLLMWGLVVERCCALLPEPETSQQHADARLLLPAVKVWSDWMLCHSSVWNPPPSFDAFDLQTENDPWDWLAKLMNILESLDDKSIELANEPKEGYTAVRLSEDASLAGFTPLMYMEPAVAWIKSEAIAHNHNVAEHALRTRKLLFFGTEYLVGVEPPVLRMEYPSNAAPRYVSAVQRIQKTPPPLQHLSEDSEEDSEEVSNGPMNGSSETSSIDGADETTRRLLRRKELLENRKATMEQRKQRMQELLRGGWVSVELVIRPRWLVPDTNCFIDRLPLLQAVAAADNHYVLAIPLIVVSELEGLRKCPRVGGFARAALRWIHEEGGSGGFVRLATTRGSLLASTTFTAESGGARGTNDDKVLATAVNLQENMPGEPDPRPEEDSKCVRRVREVVLLTDDRNLRVKALAADLPARDLPSFVTWAGLTPSEMEPSVPEASSVQK